MKRKAVLLLSLVLLLSFSAMGAAAQTNDNIVDIAAKNRNFDTLHTAIVAAGLADTLASADAQFTVFAPTDAAFGNLDPALLSAALADPQGALTTVLTYHVVAGNYSSTELLEMGTVTTLQGEDLSITTRNDQVFVNDARVVMADVPAKNGVIHAINHVLLPGAVTTADTTATTDSATTPAPADDTSGDTASKTIAEIAVEAGNFTSLVGALQATGLVETFAMPGNYTVFAPTDDAFAALGDVNLSQDELKAILLYHVVNDRLTRDQLATDDLVPTLSGGRPLFINRSGGQILNISGAELVITDIQASNGIIHVIDRVMIP
jgi:uncharacterized surface protein with fasciclin (FAS1) repeats